MKQDLLARPYPLAAQGAGARVVTLLDASTLPVVGLPQVRTLLVAGGDDLRHIALEDFVGNQRHSVRVDQRHAKRQGVKHGGQTALAFTQSFFRLFAAGNIKACAHNARDVSRSVTLLPSPVHEPDIMAVLVARAVFVGKAAFTIVGRHDLHGFRLRQVIGVHKAEPAVDRGWHFLLPPAQHPR